MDSPNQTPNYHSTVRGDRAVVEVPVHRTVYVQEEYVEQKTTQLQDTVEPHTYKQSIIQETPDLNVNTRDVAVPVKKIVTTTKTTTQPVFGGYKTVPQPTYSQVFVPRIVPQYDEKTRQTLTIKQPQIEIQDKYANKDVTVATKKILVPKETCSNTYRDATEHIWEEREKEIKLVKVYPQVNAVIECPKPLIIPYPLDPEHKHEDVHVAPPIDVGAWTEAIQNCAQAFNEPRYKGENLSRFVPPPPATKKKQSIEFWNMFSCWCVRHGDELSIDREQKLNDSWRNADVQPKVTYGGLRLKDPRYCGDLKPLKYKLHAVEVHQYIPHPCDETYLKDSSESVTDQDFGNFCDNRFKPDGPAPMMDRLIAQSRAASRN